MMGVINITPNSFSDGGQANSLEAFTGKFNTLKLAGAQIIDMGGQSTAPFNNPVGVKKEIGRFEECYLPFIKENDPENLILSFDTYRFETFSHLYEETKSYWPEARIIWNDVSGVLDDELVAFLLDRCPDCYYVYSHTEVKEREQTHAHMKAILDSSPRQTADALYGYFSEALEKFEKAGLKERIIFDPCFGFSKNYEQNMALMKDLDKLIKGELAQLPWLLGISRKSFLQKSLGVTLENKEGLMQVEALHRQLLSCWFEQFKETTLAIRLHDPFIYRAALEALNP